MDKKINEVDIKLFADEKDKEYAKELIKLAVKKDLSGLSIKGTKTPKDIFGFIHMLAFIDNIANKILESPSEQLELELPPHFFTLYLTWEMFFPANDIVASFRRFLSIWIMINEVSFIENNKLEIHFDLFLLMNKYIKEFKEHPTVQTFLSKYK